VPTGEIEVIDKIEDSVVELVKACAAKYNIDIPAVNGTFNMAHPDKSVREEGVRRFETFTRAVSMLGANYITLCSGTRLKDNLWGYHKDNATIDAWVDFIDTARQVVKISERYDIILAVEPEAANIIDTPEKAKKMMAEVSSANLKMIMDCANLFHIGKAKRENANKVISHAFEVFGNDVVIAHGKDISESDGINFCASGEGIVDYKLFVDLLKKYNYNGDIFMHGIYDESKMARGIQVVRENL
jgi:sugar phosphate isomerase/epimerase